MATAVTAASAFVEARQGRVVTQIITRASTTLTALVTLGDPTAASSSAPTHPPPPPPAPVATTRSTHPPNSGLTPGQLGALLGSILGFFALVVVLCCCLACRRRPRAAEPADDSRSEMTESEAEVRYTTRFTQRWNGPIYGWGYGPRRTDAGFTTVPPPARFPPTPRYTPYTQSPYPQIDGVRRFP